MNNEEVTMMYDAEMLETKIQDAVDYAMGNDTDLLVECLANSEKCCLALAELCRIDTGTLEAGKLPVDTLIELAASAKVLSGFIEDEVTEVIEHREANGQL